MQVFFTKKLHSLSRTMAFAFLALLNTGDISNSTNPEVA